MADGRENIKNYTRSLCVVLAVNCIIYMFFSLPEGFTFDANYIYNNLFVKSSIVFVGATVIIFLLNGLLTSDFKARLVFWRRENAYPGTRIFTDLMDKDYRIDRSVLEKSYGTLPVDPKSQNQLWYKIFKKFEFEPMVFDAHRSFLLARDITGFSFLFLCTYPMSALIAAFVFEIAFSSLIQYLLLLGVQYFISSLVSQHYGKRFACNVLAQASSASAITNNS
jgi:hypothetical protein